VFRGATSNVLFICGLSDSYKTDNGVPNKVLLRICFNPDKENALTDTIVFALLSERKMGPKLFGVFEVTIIILV
jgi:choline/ethanolamine kinase